MNCAEAEAEAKFNKTVKCFCFILLAKICVFSTLGNPFAKA